MIYHIVINSDLSIVTSAMSKGGVKKDIDHFWDISIENTPISSGDFNVYYFITKTCYFFYNRKMFKAHIEAIYFTLHGQKTFPHGDQSVGVSFD